ncbi:hypothetical protein BG418_34015 [Streptomyces sp. CBMA152]|nr:hypothetical protein [Streptomyces sp. CBMA152]
MLLALHELYRDAGYPGLRPLADEIDKNEDERALGRPGREGIAALLRGASTSAPEWANMQALVWTLAKHSHRRPDGDVEVSRFHALWLAVDAYAAASAGGDGWVDDPAAYARPLPDGLRDRSLRAQDLVKLYHQGEFAVLPTAASAALWPPDKDSASLVETALPFALSQYEERRPLLARVVLNAGALTRHHGHLERELVYAHRPQDREQVRQFCLAHLPHDVLWEELKAYSGPGDNPDYPRNLRARYLTDIITHRNATDLAALLAHLARKVPGYAGDDKTYDDIALHSLYRALAEHSDVQALSELLAVLAEEPDADHGPDLSQHLWGEIARARSPLAPLLSALRENGQAWQTTSILRRTLTIDVMGSRRNDLELVDELSQAGLAEDADTAAFMSQLTEVVHLLASTHTRTGGPTRTDILKRWGYL